MKNNRLQRALCAFLAFVMVFTMIPSTAFATEIKSVTYGDINTDGEIDIRDALLLQKYLLGITPNSFNQESADVNDDSEIDLRDLLSIKKYLVGWDIKLGPTKVTVSFYDGERLVDQLQVEEGEMLGRIPSNEKTSKSNGVFVGWYTDPTFETPFYPDSPVTQDMKVYGKYSAFDASTLTVTSFAQVDLAPDASFTVVGTGNLEEITLTAMDGSEPVELAITGNGPYTITAVGGFNSGASYELTLPDGLNFVGTNGQTMPETVRTASFTIYRDAVANIQMSDAVKYVQHANPAELQAGSTVTASGIAVGDLICFYKTTNPKDRDYTTGNAYLDDPETWFKAASVSGDVVTLAVLDESDNEKLYNVPDNFPVMGPLPTGETGTLTLENDQDGYTLDTQFYAQMTEKAEDATLEKALEKLSVGDFISIFVASGDIESEGDVYFGKITSIENGVITYVKSSAQEIRDAGDLYVEPVVSGDDMVSEEAREQIEQIVLEQLSDSGFAEEAAYVLAELAVKTDGFRNMEGVQVLLTDENGQPLSEEEIALLNLGASFELSDDIELTVEVITSGDQLHFQDKGSVQLGVGIDATFEVEAEDGKVVIDLSAAFVQELALGITANGSLVKKEILFIPVPVGVKVGASVDLMSYTGVRVDVQAYTVGEEEQGLYDQFMDVVKNPEKLADVLAENEKFAAVAEGLKTVGDVFDKIEELEGKIQQLEDQADTALAYTEDLIMLWDMVDAMNTDNKISQDEWKQMGQALGKTNVSEDLMEMLNVSTETELDADRYAEGLNGLLEKYSEMLEKETDWITLVEKEMCSVQTSVCGLVIYFDANFVVRADVNIAMGTSMQYEVGKRYNFWFKVGLFKPEAGSSTMDLIDESFAFQFYVMGKIGLKMGIKATVGLALGAKDLAQVGLSLEVGPYVKIYGFFIYEYERWRQANASTWTSNEQMAGAMYVDFGLYLIVSMEASALGDLFSVEYTFVDEEYPLLEAGKKKYPYEFFYEPLEDELVLVQDADANSTNGVAMVLPDEYRAVSYCNLTNGYLGAEAFDWDNYHIMLSNPAFSIDENGVITVAVPENTRYMECDLILTYKYGKLAFSTYDMQVVIPLVWTNLSADEISQYFTASVRIGNDTDGYSIAWSKRVRKNEEFTLPTEEELRELIGYNEAIYSSFSYPDAGKTVSIISNTSYDCNVTYTDYAITVSGIQNSDGTTTSKTFHTTYGHAFDFSALASTGTGIAGDVNTAKYTKFLGVSTAATITANGQTSAIDLTQPITGKVAEAILSGSVAATAEYGDDSVLVTYVFSGIDAPDYIERIRRGVTPAYDIHTVAAEYGMAVKDVSPKMGKVNTATTFYVECGEIVGEKYTLSFEENGGNAVKDLERVGGSLIGTLPTPTRSGYTFAGWYADEALTTPFEAYLMPKEATVAYAKWTANQFKVTLNVNGGNPLEEGTETVTVTYGGAYGSLPAAVRDGYGFRGWYTTATCDAGTEVTAETLVTVAADQTLYAKWHKLVEIAGTFAYTSPETNPVYAKGVAVELLPNEDSWPVAAEGAPELKRDSFTIKFMRQGDSAYIEGYPANAGTYDVTITRPADDYYAAFSQTITGILTIEKATRVIERADFLFVDSGYNYMDLRVADGAIDDLHPKATITYQLDQKSEDLVVMNFGGSAVAKAADEVVHIVGLFPDTEYAAKISITGDPNYYDTASLLYNLVGKTDAAPTDSWKNHLEPFEIVEGVYEYTITTPGQLAYLAYLVNTENTEYSSTSKITNFNFTYYYAESQAKLAGYTFKLGADIDLSAYAWEPIGRDVCHTVDYTLTGDEEFIIPGTRGEILRVAYYQHFGGNFSGEGYTITGMYVDGTIASEAGENSYESLTVHGGLFGYIYGTSNITQVIIENSYVTSSGRCASVVAYATGASKEERVMIDNCYSEATIDGKDRAAGIVGLVEKGDIFWCYNLGRVYSKGTESSVGGIVASVQGADGAPVVVSGCINYGDIYGPNATNVGGIVGWSEWPNISTCVNYGSVRADQDVGGIVGQVNDSGALTYANVVDCVNYGDISGGANYRVGGVAGYVLVGRIVNSANFGDITGYGDCIGGVTGEHDENKHAKTINCVNYGTVTSTSTRYIGAVIGRNNSDKGTVGPVYYDKSVNTVKSSGTKKGSEDSNDNLEAYSFNGPSSMLQSNLNGWSDFEDYEATTWVKDGTGYGYIPESVYEMLYAE